MLDLKNEFGFGGSGYYRYSAYKRGKKPFFIVKFYRLSLLDSFFASRTEWKALRYFRNEGREGWFKIVGDCKKACSKSTSLLHNVDDCYFR